MRPDASAPSSVAVVRWSPHTYRPPPRRTGRKASVGGACRGEVRDGVAAQAAAAHSCAMHAPSPHSPPHATRLVGLRKGDPVRAEVPPGRHLARPKPGAQLGLCRRRQLLVRQRILRADGADGDERLPGGGVAAGDLRGEAPAAGGREERAGSEEWVPDASWLATHQRREQADCLRPDSLEQEGGSHVVHDAAALSIQVQLVAGPGGVKGGRGVVAGRVRQLRGRRPAQ